MSTVHQRLVAKAVRQTKKVTPILVCKADPIVEKVPSTVLIIAGALDEACDEPYVAGCDRFYDAQATKIVAALSSLPGGTMDALLVKLLDAKRSLLRVRA